MKALLSILTILVFPIDGLAAESYQGPIYDSHAHLSSNSQPDKASADLLGAGFGKVALFVKAERIEEAEVVPKERVLIFSDPFDRKKVKLGKRKKKILYKFSKKNLNAIGAALTAGKAVGFGEIYLRLSYAPFAPDGLHTPVDSEGVKTLFTMAKVKEAPVHIHLEADHASELKYLLETYPGVNIILAHCGYMKPEVLSSFLDRWPNLYAETSLVFNPEVPRFNNLPLENGNLRPDWEALFLRHSDRMLLGTDYAEFRSDQAPRILLYYRNILGLLPREEAEKIAFRNFNRLFVR